MAFTDLFGGKYKSQFNLDTQNAQLTGVTKDSTGAALGSCIVRAFRTSDDVLLAESVSNGSGVYKIGVPVGISCYLVSYKTGSPDVAGTTLNTLVGVGGY